MFGPTLYLLPYFVKALDAANRKIVLLSPNFHHAYLRVRYFAYHGPVRKSLPLFCGQTFLIILQMSLV